MSGEFIDLLTKIVLLAIALIGLYKASKYRSGSDASEGASPKVKGSDDDSIWSFFVEFSGYFALVLVPMGFMFLFQFGIVKLTELHETVSPEDQSIPELHLDPDSTELEIMLAAAIRVKSSVRKGQRLTEVVTKALEEGDFEVAIRAASAIPSNVTSDQQLKRVMDAIPNKDRSDVLGNESTQPAPESDPELTQN